MTQEKQYANSIFQIERSDNVKMRRKTNLFYTSGQDSNFLTFSNYTEAMTGNFLATDVKLFPSKFLCLNIPELNSYTKSQFIKGLVSYYENTQAFLRDMCAYHGYNVEEKCKPLGWLLDYIYNFDSSISIEYVGQVTEQDYNGIYADTICVIDAADCAYGIIHRSENPDRSSYEDYSYMSSSYLYGWYNTVQEPTGEVEQYIGPEEYKNVSPYTGDDQSYIYYVPVTEGIEIIRPDEPRDIVFNVVIPLFDIINVDSNDNTDVIQDMMSIPCNEAAASVINVPYGIWFAKDKIVLSRDGTSWSPSWSLAIGSQFKPFPYSESPISEVTQSERASAFMTFAQALIRQDKLLSKIGMVTKTIDGLTSRINDIDANIKSMGTSYNIDSLQLELTESLSYISGRLSYMQGEIDDLRIS